MPRLYIEIHVRTGVGGEVPRWIAVRGCLCRSTPGLIVIAMPDASRPTRLQAIFHGLCPRCRSGKIFSRSLFAGLPKMNDVCPACGLKFEREQGYFLGALYMSYAMAVPLMALLVALFWLFTN